MFSAFQTEQRIGNLK